MKAHLFAGIACLFSASPPLHAAALSIGDYSFESLVMSAGGYGYNIGPSWTGTNGSSNGNAFEEYITGFVSQGHNHLGMENNYDVWQNLAFTYQANTRYTLTVACGNRAGQTNSGNVSQYILADTAGTVYATGSYNASALAAGTFGDAPSLVFDTTSNTAAIGKTIRIRLHSGGTGRSHFDNIRLDASSLSPTVATVANLPAVNVTGASAIVRGQVTNPGSSTPTIKIFYGPTDGGTNETLWANSISLGSQGGLFSSGIGGLANGVPTVFRVQATNSAGVSWAPSSLSFTPSGALVPASAVINEFHEKPEDRHELEEFVEIYNPGDSALTMTGWSLSKAVDFTFSTYTLPAHGFVVVALNPAAINARYGFTPLGPYMSKLGGSDTINLKNASGTIVDTVNYTAGFPWPSAIDGQGNSAELIHPGLDNSLAGSWRASAGAPTPGMLNSTYVEANLTPPHIENVAHTPKAPAPGQAVAVTAKVTSTRALGAVTLSYQTVDPGSYIRRSDAAYSTGWTSVTMVDNGSGGDAVSGDGIYTATLPAALQTNRRLVRYRITFADNLGNSQTVPYADDSQGNLAYYVYSGVPAWSGSLRPGADSAQVFSPATLASVPVYTLIAGAADVSDSQYNGGYDSEDMQGTFVYDGVVYDNIVYHNRGDGSTYQSGKNKWKFKFNPARDLAAKDNNGVPYAETWGSFASGSCASPWAPLNRGMAGVEEALSLKIYQLAGVPSPRTNYYHFRVVRSAVETPAAGSSVSDSIFGTTDGQYAGDFWGLYMAIEPIKGGFLDDRKLPDGNIYKIQDGLGDPEHLLPGDPGTVSDYNSYITAVQASTAPTEAWWRANLDLDDYYTFHAINRLIGNVDLRAGENHYFYRRSTDNRWVVIPWDLDMMFIAMGHQGSTIDGESIPGVITTQRALTTQPALALEFRNRGREILDLLGSDGTANGGQIGQLIDELAQIVAPTGSTDNLANADAAMWNMNPRTAGADGNHSGQGNHKGNFFYAPFADSRISGNWTRYLKNPSFSGVASHADMMDYLRQYSTNTWTGGTWTVNNGVQYGYGFQSLLSEVADAAIPAKPVIAYTGNPGYPTNRLSFSASTYSGTGAYASTQWRISEISAPGIPGYMAGAPRKYEIETGWSATTAGTTVIVPTTATTTGRTYRARVRYKDATGRCSNWSNPVTLAATAPTSTAIHGWNFDDSTTVTSYLLPSRTTGGAALTTQATGGTTAFVRDTSSSQGFTSSPAHLRINNPDGANVTFALPTTGYANPVAQVETRRSSTGAPETQNWSYTTDGGTTWIPFLGITPNSDAAVVQELDFRAISGAANNPKFGVRVAIAHTAGATNGGTTGNHRFDNFALTGDPLPGSYAAWIKTAFDSTQQANNLISGADADPDGDGRSNLMEFAFNSLPMTKDLAKVDFTWTSSGGNRYPGLKFKRPLGITGVLYELRASNDLVNWTTVSTTPATAADKGNGTEEIVMRDIVTDAQPKRFLRMRVTAVP